MYASLQSQAIDKMDTAQDEVAPLKYTPFGKSAELPAHVLQNKAADLSVASLASAHSKYHSPAAGIVTLVIMCVLVGGSCIALAILQLQSYLKTRAKVAVSEDEKGLLSAQEMESDDDMI